MAKDIKGQNSIGSPTEGKEQNVEYGMFGGGNSRTKKRESKILQVVHSLKVDLDTIKANYEIFSTENE